MSLGVAILAGGRGTRLHPLTRGVPKALAPFDGHTLLDHQLQRVHSLRPDRVVLVLHHQHALISAHAAGRAASVVEPRPLGTAGGLALLPPGPDRWLVLNVDHISDVDLTALVEEARGPCTAALWSAPVPIDEGVVTIQDGRVVRWQERPVLRLPVTTGLYVFTRAALQGALDGSPCDMPGLVERLMPQGVHAWMHRGQWFDVGTPERLARAERWWRTLATQPGASGCLQ